MSEQALKNTAIGLQCLSLLLFTVFIAVPGRSAAAGGMAVLALLAFLWHTGSRGFLVGLIPYFVMLYCFNSLRGYADNISPFQIHVKDIADLSRMLTGGYLVSAWLQAHLHRSEGLILALCVVYGFHFVYPVLMGMALWFTDRTHYWTYLIGLSAMTYTGFVLFCLFPAAPPWWASYFGYIPEHVEALGVGAERMLQTPNPVAAFPSLHAAYSVYIAMFAMYRWPKWGRLALVIPIAVAFSTLYLGHHYVIDLLAGSLLAAATMYFVRWLPTRLSARI